MLMRCWLHCHCFKLYFKLVYFVVSSCDFVSCDVWRAQWWRRRWRCRPEWRQKITQSDWWSPLNRKQLQSTCANCDSISWYPTLQSRRRWIVTAARRRPGLIVTVTTRRTKPRQVMIGGAAWAQLHVLDETSPINGNGVKTQNPQLMKLRLTRMSRAIIRRCSSSSTAVWRTVL